MCHIQNLAINFKFENMPTTYLRMPLGSEHQNKGNLGWNFIENRKEIGQVEGTIHITERESHPYQ